VSGNKENAIVKALQRHPAKDRIMHADFQRVLMDVAITVDVPVHFTNEDNCIGVKQSGGAISHVMSTVHISCLPGDLPEYLEIDVSELDLGDSVHLSEMTLPAGVTIPELELGADHDQVVVSVVTTRATVEEDEPSEAAAEGGEESGDAAESED
jgi:large subunit ribosomal protein L25